MPQQRLALTARAPQGAITALNAAVINSHDAINRAHTPVRKYSCGSIEAYFNARNPKNKQCRL